MLKFCVLKILFIGPRTAGEVVGVSHPNAATTTKARRGEASGQPRWWKWSEDATRHTLTENRVPVHLLSGPANDVVVLERAEEVEGVSRELFLEPISARFFS